MPTIAKLNRPEFSLDYDVNYPHPKGCELATAYLSLWPIRLHQVLTHYKSTTHGLNTREFGVTQTHS